MVKARRMVGLFAAMAMAGALPVVLASPAQATYTDCTNYMRNMGYKVGSKVQDACSYGEDGFVGEQMCYSILVAVSVNLDHARTACDQAARD
ncbi:hypothetical protein [Streptomyces goshikiensis]|uniref:hypothetical protein n=1 Tax=Streptomyces goshikiensis TaxID=1942 RepID=UPI0033244648